MVNFLNIQIFRLLKIVDTTLLIYSNKIENHLFVTDFKHRTSVLYFLLVSIYIDFFNNYFCNMKNTDIYCILVYYTQNVSARLENM